MWFIPPLFPSAGPVTVGFNGRQWLFSGWSDTDFLLGGLWDGVKCGLFYVPISLPPNNYTTFNIYTSNTGFTQATYYQVRTPTGSALMPPFDVYDGNWRHMIIALDTASGIGKILLNATNIGPPTVTYMFIVDSPPEVWPPIGHDAPCTAVGFYGNSVGVPQVSRWLDFNGPQGQGGTPHYVTPAIQLADVQVWVGTYIDPTVSANFAKFVSIVDGKGYPVNPATAAAAFGTQTFLFKGKASDSSFFVNRGNGGAFTKIGTAADFTPAPSY